MTQQPQDEAAPLDLAPDPRLVAVYSSAAAIVCPSLSEARALVAAAGGGERRPHGSFDGWRVWLPGGAEAMIFVAGMEGAPAVYAATLQARRLCLEARAIAYFGGAERLPAVGGAPAARMAWISESAWLHLPPCVRAPDSPPILNQDGAEIDRTEAGESNDDIKFVSHSISWKQPKSGGNDRAASIRIATAPRALDTPLDWRWMRENAGADVDAVDRGAAAFAAAIQAAMPPSVPAAPGSLGAILLREALSGAKFESMDGDLHGVLSVLAGELSA